MLRPRKGSTHTMTRWMAAGTILLLALTCVLAQTGPPASQPGGPQIGPGTATCDGTGIRQGPGNRRGRSHGRGVPASGCPGCAGPAAAISSFPSEELSPSELDGLLFMREEEKLARDAYRTLFAAWGLPLFARIAGSEQRHMDLVGALLDKYGIDDPAPSQPGVFANPQLQALHDDLIGRGSVSLEDALQVGATIEDLDIFDLGTAIDGTDNEDMLWAWENLQRGSRNHLRAFSRQLEARGLEYTARFLSPGEIAEIVTSPVERGAGSCPNQSSSNRPGYSGPHVR